MSKSRSMQRKARSHQTLCSKQTIAILPIHHKVMLIGPKMGRKHYHHHHHQRNVTYLKVHVVDEPEAVDLLHDTDRYVKHPGKQRYLLGKLETRQTKRHSQRTRQSTVSDHLHSSQIPTLQHPIPNTVEVGSAKLSRCFCQVKPSHTVDYPSMSRHQ